MVLYIIFSQVDSCQGCIYGSLTLDTKDISKMDDHVLIMTHESLATRSLKCYILDT